MKVAALARRYDNTTGFENIVHQERVDFAIFKQVHGGRMATQEEIAAARVRSVPEGFSVWRSQNGNLFAIRDE